MINSVIGANVKIGSGAVVEDSVIMSDTVIEKNAKVEYSLIDTNVTVSEGASVGQPKEDGAGIAVIGKGLTVARNKKIAGGLMVNADKLAELE